MTQKDVAKDLRKAIGDPLALSDDDTILDLTQGTWLRLKYQLIDVIREFLKSIGIYPKW